MTNESTEPHRLQPAVSVLAAALSVLDVHWDELPAARRRELIRAAHRCAETLLGQLLEHACPSLEARPRRDPRPGRPLADHVRAVAAARCSMVTAETDMPSRLLVGLPDQLLGTLLATLLGNFQDTQAAPLRLHTCLVEDGRRVRLELKGAGVAQDAAGPLEPLCMSATEPDQAERAVGRALRDWFARKFDVTVQAAMPVGEQPDLTVVLEMPTHAATGTSACQS